MESVPLHRLEAEWRRQVAGPRLAHQLAAWRKQSPAPAPFTDAASLMRLFRGSAQRSGPGRRPEAVARVPGRTEKRDGADRHVTGR